ncbi:MAG: type II toxin-antitoxin system HipA family toxin [Oscillospiraceae bacterium]|nr:type II toxin-antitoxin system HipA family toxin [Oscillospiraceae bacterium]
MSGNDIKFGLKAVRVKYADRYVGTVALSNNGKTAFSYDDEWIESGFSISPFSLPLEKKVFTPKSKHFEGLFGIFADSLPDAWGRLLVDRILKKHDPDGRATVIDRLALVGRSGMGALEYEPDYDLSGGEELKDFDYLSEECRKILKTEYSEELDGLYRLGGSSGGARPKIMTKLENKDWIIKFPAHSDSPDIGIKEYKYSECAKKCGIKMTETRLFPSEKCEGYFGTVRFDRESGRKIHMATAAALLEADFNSPCLDYNALMKLTRIITDENREDTENMFRRACFNVFAHNRDDHAKNFTFLYNEDENTWRLSPAYDLTYSDTWFGEHTTSVDGNGKDPGEKELLNVALKAGISRMRAMDIISFIKDTATKELL